MFTPAKITRWEERTGRVEGKPRGFTELRGPVAHSPPGVSFV